MKIGCAVLAVCALLVIGGTAFLTVVGAAGGAYFLTARSSDNGGEEIAWQEARSAAEEATRTEEEAARAADDAARVGESTTENAAKDLAAGQSTEPVAGATTSSATSPAPPAQQPATTQPTSPPDASPKDQASATTTATPASGTSASTASPTGASAGSAVRASGDGVVVLIAGAARYPLPATVLPGTYTIEVTFPGEPPVQTGKVRVKAGEAVVITCKSTMGICNPG
ncbi:MAG: hypothetical protein EXR69_10855 [Myxococcales bacterium]|nr:hypothetical protein [Myxococcales bacterium]